MTIPSPGPVRVGHVIVCGLDDVGLRIVEQLHAAGERVLVIEDDADERLRRIVAGLGIEVQAGDARRGQVLIEAGIDTAAAVICVADSDLENLEVALTARERSDRLRVVVQLSNAAVGRAVSRLTGPGTVLDTAALAAPAFVEASLRRNQHALELGGHPFVVAERTVEQAGSLRATFGDLAPIAVVRAEGGELVIGPGRDLPVRPGDRVTVIGPPAEFADLRGTAASRPGTDPPQRHLLRPAARTVSAMRVMLGDVERAFWLTLVALGAVAILSVGILMASYHGAGGRRMGVIDAAYFTVETLTTVGFGDFYFANQHGLLRIWAILLMILGATLVTILYARLTDLLITRRLSATAGRRRATRMRGHVILVGLGSVGLRVLEQLRAENRDVVVLERDEGNRYLTTAREMGVPVIIGDSTLRQNLDAANLHTASAVAVLTSNDLANIETGLAVDDLLGARKVHVPVVLRVFDRRLAATIERNFGFRHVRSTSALAAPWFVGAALGLTILNTFYIEDQPFLVGRLTVTGDGGLAGRPMVELGARIRVLAISRQRARELEYPPRRDTRFEAGDQAYLVGRYEELLQVLRSERGS